MFQKIEALFHLLVFSLFIISCQQEVSVSPTPIPKIESGSIFINTIPTDVEIWVDGRPSGFSTPDTVKWLKEGEHEIILRTSLFNDHKVQLSTKNNIVTNYFYNYFEDPKNLGSISIISEPPNCTIFFNDSLIQDYKTPHKISSLLVNKYKIKVSFPEHRSDSTIVQVYGGKESIVNLAPIDTSIWVNYNSSNSRIKDNVLYDLYIDEQNSIWMGSRIGIIEHMGKSWNFYNSNNSPLPHVIVTKIDKPNQNIFWFGTINGLLKIENDSWLPYTTDNSELPGGFINDITHDNNGVVWIGTDNGLVKIDNDKWEIYNNTNSKLRSNFIKTIAIDPRDNSVWAGSNNEGIAHFDDQNNWEFFTTNSYENNDTSKIMMLGNKKFGNIKSVNQFILRNSISALAIDLDGIIWAGFSVKVLKHEVVEPGGIQKLDGLNWVTIDLGFEQLLVYDIFVTQDNTKLVSSNKGIIKIDDSGVDIINTGNSDIHSNLIRAVKLDQNGILWIASGDRGLIKYKNFKAN